MQVIYNPPYEVQDRPERIENYSNGLYSELEDLPWFLLQPYEN